MRIPGLILRDQFMLTIIFHFIYFWLCWVFIATWGASLIGAWALEPVGMEGAHEA